MLIRKSTDSLQSKKIADKFRKELGFVLRPVLEAAVSRGELVEAVVDDQVVGFCHYHLRKDGWTTIYEIASTHPGAGRALLTSLPKPLQLKCPVGLSSNGFYQHMGGTLKAVVAGRKRDLNLWVWE